MKNKITYIAFLATLFIPNIAYAYLDPGSGSIILQAILGFIAAAFTAISFQWNRFKNFLKKIFNKNKKIKSE